MNKGLFYMITASERQHLKDVIAQLMLAANPQEYNEEEAHQAIELLATLSPMDTEDFLSAAEISLIDEEFEGIL